MNDRVNGFVWGIASGVVATIMIGLSMGWIVTGSKAGSKADAMANERAQSALVAAMTPVCVDKFQRAEGYAGKLASLKKIGASWERRDFVAKGAWANVGKEANFALADACAESLNNL